MTPENFNWKNFSHGTIVNMEIDIMYDAIHTSEGLEEWLVGEANFKRNGKVLSKEDYIFTGDTYHWKWLAKDYEVKGKVLGSFPDRRIQFTFGDNFEVSIQLKSMQDSRTKVILEQRRTDGKETPDFGFLNCCVCWVFFLTNLKSTQEFGVDLRETKVREEFLVNR